MTTTLNCLGWMQNQDDQPPCTTAQEVGQLCNLGYTVSLTNFQESDYVPNTTTTNGCTCSWSIYNLLSACSYCLGQYQYTSWGTWITDCGSYASNTSYLPSGLSISQGIPFWAATNPSTWKNAVFNVTQAADIATAAQPDVTGGPLPTSTTTASSASSVSVGAIVGGVIGSIAIIIIGWLFIVWAVRRRRRQRAHAGPASYPSFNAFQPVTVPSIRNRTIQPPFGHAHMSLASVSPYLTSPIHSTTSLAPTSLVSPVSSGFSANGHHAAPPLADAADMISPFLAMPSSRQTNRSDTSPPTGKAAEALSERVMAPPGQRARLNPPPYSASVEPGSSGTTTTWARRLSTKKQKKRKGSMSVATTYSGDSETSTRESATTVHAGPRAERSRPRVATPGTRTVGSVESAVNAGGVGSIEGGGSVEMTQSGRADESDQRPPAV